MAMQDFDDVDMLRVENSLNVFMDYLNDEMSLIKYFNGM